MRLRIRKCNDVDITKTFSASIRGGMRGYGDVNALETFSNDLFPCVKTLNGFSVLVEVDSLSSKNEEKDDAKPIDAFIKQYPHGFNDGFLFTDGICPAITISSWQHNNFIIEIYEENEAEDTASDKAGIY